MNADAERSPAAQSSLGQSGKVVGFTFKLVSQALIYDVWCNSGGASVDDVEQLVALIENLLCQAHEAWPAFDVPRDVFVAACALACEGDAPLASLATVRASDLYLVSACMRDDRAAIAAFSRLCESAVAAAMRRHRPSSISREDVAQILRERLLVGTPERPPRIGEYRGRGRLDQWLRVAASRLAIDVMRGRGRLEDPIDGAALCDGFAAGDVVEMQLLRQTYGAAFKEEFEQAAQSLGRRDARLLREHFVHGLTMAKMAAIHGTSKSTVARWVAAARDRLVDDVRARLGERFNLDASELRSVMRLVRSELQLSLSRVFVSPE